MSQLNRNFSSSLSAGGHTLDTGGMQIRNDASGFSVVNQAVSSGVVDSSMTKNDAEEYRKGYADYIQRAHNSVVKLANSENLSHSETARLAHSLSNMTVHDIAEKYSVGEDKAQQISQDARVLDQHYTGHSYTDQTRAGGNFSVGAGGSASLEKIGAVFNIGGGVNSSVESSNASNHGDSTQSSSSNSFAETERRFNSSIKDIASSNRNDEVTQLARDHVDTLSKIDQYSQEKAFNENMAKNYQESYNKAQSMSFSTRRNLTDAAFEIAIKEEGYTLSEASRMTRSQRPQDRAIVQSWFDRAKGREEARSHPSMPAMKQPVNWNGYDRSTVQKNFEQEFSAREERAQNNIKTFETKAQNIKDERQDNFESKKEYLASKGVTNKNMDQRKQEIENRMHKNQINVEKRGDRGAIKSAWKTAWNTITNKEKN
jgi:hypothetical protein